MSLTSTILIVQQESEQVNNAILSVTPHEMAIIQQPLTSGSTTTQTQHQTAPVNAGYENQPMPTPPKIQVALIMSSLCACVFVAAIEMTIISTALPDIAAHFQSPFGYQWVGSAYILGNTATIPTWGKISDIWGRKLIMLIAIAIFFAGNLTCALADEIALFLAGRAVQGVGAAGLLTLVNIAISDLFSMRDRGLYYGLTSVSWAVASSVGPILGGVFTQQAS
jgi:MFS family permease